MRIPMDNQVLNDYRDFANTALSGLRVKQPVS